MSRRATPWGICAPVRVGHLFLIAAVIANSGVQAQVTDTAPASKRIQVLRIVEANAAKRAQSSSARKAVPRSRAVAKKPSSAPLLYPDTTVEPTFAAMRAVMPTWNGFPESSARQTETFSIDSPAVELTSSFGASYSPDAALSAPAATAESSEVENSRHAVADAEQAHRVEGMVERQNRPESTNKPIFQLMAMLGGAMTAVAFCWCLVKTTPKPAFADPRGELRLGAEVYGAEAAAV